MEARGHRQARIANHPAANRQCSPRDLSLHCTPNLHQCATPTARTTHMSFKSRPQSVSLPPSSGRTPFLMWTTANCHHGSEWHAHHLVQACPHIHLHRHQFRHLHNNIFNHRLSRPHTNLRRHVLYAGTIDVTVSVFNLGHLSW